MKTRRRTGGLPGKAPRKRTGQRVPEISRRDPVLRGPLTFRYEVRSSGEMRVSIQETTSGAGERTSQVVERATEEFAAFLERFLRGPRPPLEGVRHRRDPLRVAGLTTTEMLHGFLETDFAEGWFQARDIREAFQSVHGPIRLRSLSACLARLHRDGVLERAGNPRRWAYRVRNPYPPNPTREITLP